MRQLAFAICILAASSTAAAQDDESAGRRAFRLGQAHYENGEFAEAAVQFEEAYRLSGRARLLYNAYLAYRDMQDLPNSARTLRQFLAEGDDLTAAERDQLQARLAAIERAMADQTEVAPEATPPPQREAPAEPAPPETVTADTETQPAPASATGGGFSPSPVGFIVAGGGAALLVGAIITGVMSSGDLSTLEDRCPMDRCPDDPELRDAQSRGATLATVTDVLWVSGVVAMAAGVTLIFVLQDDSDSATAGMACTPEGCFGSVRGSF